MSYCINCGAQLPNCAKFCNECGTKQEISENQLSAKSKSSYNPVFQNIEESECTEVMHSTPSAVGNNSSLTPTLQEQTDEQENLSGVESDEINIENDKETESNSSFDNTKEENDVEEEDNGINLLRLLSSSKRNTPDMTSNIYDAKTVSDISTYENDIDDPYWDDVKPEIDNEIYQIDRSVILKGVGCICALFLLIAYLVYMI